MNKDLKKLYDLMLNYQGQVVKHRIEDDYHQITIMYKENHGMGLFRRSRQNKYQKTRYASIKLTPRER